MILEYLSNILLITARRTEAAAIKTLADETDNVTRNLGKELPLYAT